MKRLTPLVLPALLALATLLPAPALCGGDLDAFVGGISAQVRADLPGFKARVAAEFGVPVPEVEAVIGRVRRPEDAYMVMKVGKVANQPREAVLAEYEANSGQGWGVMAKNLGIKPGSPEFHELKRGYDGDDGPGKGKGKKGNKGKKH